MNGLEYIVLGERFLFRPTETDQKRAKERFKQGADRAVELRGETHVAEHIIDERANRAKQLCDAGAARPEGPSVSREFDRLYATTGRPSIPPEPAPHPPREPSTVCGRT